MQGLNLVEVSGEEEGGEVGESVCVGDEEGVG